MIGSKKTLKNKRNSQVLEEKVMMILMIDSYFEDRFDSFLSLLSHLLVVV